MNKKLIKWTREYIESKIKRACNRRNINIPDFNNRDDLLKTVKLINNTSFM